MKGGLMSALPWLFRQGTCIFLCVLFQWSLYSTNQEKVLSFLTSHELCELPQSIPTAEVIAHIMVRVILSCVVPLFLFLLVLVIEPQ